MKPSPQSSHETWERLLDQALKRLPDRPAPSTLMPRVLAAIAARAHLPWYRQSWSRWPRLAQGVALGVLSLLLGALTYACLHFPELAAPGDLSARLQTWIAPLVALWSVLQALGSVVVALCHRAGGWLCLGLGAMCLAAYLSAIGAGTALYRLANSKRG